MTSDNSDNFKGWFVLVLRVVMVVMAFVGLSVGIGMAWGALLSRVTGLELRQAQVEARVQEVRVDIQTLIRLQSGTSDSHSTTPAGFAQSSEL